MKHKRRVTWLALAAGLAISAAGSLMGQQRSFAELVGGGAIGPMPSPANVQIPYITWGGDMATFHANGGLTTKAGSLIQKQGLSVRLVPGDDFPQQVRDYRAGKSPFLRGTFHMMGLASEVIGADPRTKGVVVLQMTWSAGDHLVGRAEIKSASDLKGKTVALQQAGPHVGMLDDVLKAARLSWSDIKVVWTKDLTGSGDSPVEVFRKRSDVHACFAITPDMAGLTGGLDKTGTGAEGTVKGARVVVSTAQLSRSIADVYVVRKDFYDAHKDWVTKFVAAYLKGCEETLELRKQHKEKGSAAYRALLQTTQDIYGRTTIPVLDDADGLIADCTFVGYPGNVAFFTQASNLSGFEALHRAALDVAVNLGYAKERYGLFPSGLDYASPVFTQYLTRTVLDRGEGRFDAEAVQREIELLDSGALDERTILEFTIGFEANQTAFGQEQYGAEFQRVVEAANKFGNAVIAIRGHSDPSKTLLELVKAGLQKGLLKRTGTPGNYSYFLNGQPLDLKATTTLAQLIESGSFDGVADANPRETMQSALNLSRARAEAVRDAVVQYAKGKGLTIDRTQIQPVGVGIREPVVPKPSNADQARANMRVEFRLLRVQAEAIKSSDFDF